MKRGRKTGKAIVDYALYKGDEFLDIGSADYLSNKWGLTKKSLYWLATSTRAKNLKHDRGFVVVSLGVDDNV